jgi:hypothetical protein
MTIMLENLCPLTIFLMKRVRAFLYACLVASVLRQPPPKDHLDPALDPDPTFAAHDKDSPFSIFRTISYLASIASRLGPRKIKFSALPLTFFHPSPTLPKMFSKQTNPHQLHSTNCNLPEQIPAEDIHCCFGWREQSAFRCSALAQQSTTQIWIPVRTNHSWLRVADGDDCLCEQARKTRRFNAAAKAASVLLDFWGALGSRPQVNVLFAVSKKCEPKKVLFYMHRTKKFSFTCTA